MEKGLEDSNLDETVGEDKLNQDSKSLNDIHVSLVENQEKVGKEREKINQTMEENKGLIHHLQNYVIEEAIPQVSVPMANLTSPDSTVEMSTYEPINITDDSFELLENTPKKAVSTKQFEAITDDCETVPPQNLANNETQSPKKDDKLKDPQVFSKPKENYGGKGKVAENPKYRYKKESKPESPVKRMPLEDESVNPSTECGGLEFLGSQSSKADVTIVSPGVKRKNSTNERSSSQVSSSSRIGPYDFKKSKKIKSEKEEDSLASENEIDCSEREEISYGRGNDTKCSEREEVSLASGSDTKCSEREEVSLASGSDTKCSEREEVSLASGSDTKCSEREEISVARGNDTKCSEREETSPTRGNDKMCGEREESSLITRSYERQESSHSSASFCVPCSEIEDSPLTSGSEDGMFREIEVSSLTSSNIRVELSQSELRDSYMSNTRDLSDLIASISNEKSDSSHYISQSQIDQSHNERVNLNLPSSTSRISQSQIDQGHNERVNKNLPSSSGITNVNTYSSNSEHLSNKSVQNDVTCRKKDQLSLRSRINDEMCSEKDSSLPSGSYCMTCSEREDSSKNDDFMFSGREDSTLTLSESFLTTVSDLSEQISNTKEDDSSSASEEL